LNDPAAFLHKDQKLRAAQDTVEILQALTSGKIVLFEEDNPQKVEVETTESEPKQEDAQIADIPPEKVTEDQQTVPEKIPETVKPIRRGVRK